MILKQKNFLTYLKNYSSLKFQVVQVYYTIVPPYVSDTEIASGSRTPPFIDHSPLPKHSKKRL